MTYRDLFPSRPAVIGMVHLLPLPGSPGYEGDLQAVISRAVSDAQTLAAGGVDAVLVENFHDHPFYPETSEPETVAAMTLCASEVARAVSLPLGIQVLRNSWKASLAIASVVGARFIRLNVLTEAMVTDQGVIGGVAHLAARYRRFLGAERVLIFADLYSKHAAPLARRPLPVVARDMAHRGGADAIIVSGQESSDPPRAEELQEIGEAVPDVPLILGSGMTAAKAELAARADGVIFGYGSKPGGNMTRPVSLELTTEFMDVVRAGTHRERTVERRGSEREKVR